MWRVREAISAALPELPSGFDKEKRPPEVQARPSLFDAVRSQLGLKLAATKGPVSKQFLIGCPSENAYRRYSMA
jgi:uncharacterized protein (TIGR03435 family)